MIHLERLDHLVLTVADIERSCDFYQRVLGMQIVRFGAGRTALQFGQQKINLHPASAPLQPHALRPTPGSADLCLVTRTATADVLAHLRAHAVAVEQGPVARTGALGPIESVYVRDPDGNLIEISRYPGEEHPQR
ncbi:VOC family protein [Stenotrophomonas maltophilia]|jgi:catechol 2,3-dioxygenase-like lactoylglutathione lyase family enzyme|uniref:VOC family virulence protein n=2 Tax=Stenotrophomonas pavanii TaxID=487698 RepID=A0A246L1J1_9GAMM|nr:MULTISPECIES: VOC family protein [Stenotrophomonas]KAA3600279.1 VOC family protein [Stenotrophomonas maltophilia]KOO79698.1 glyoxalase [Stenotrophomonas maltophilia]KRG81445.1 glyoxalase [Stenotrophomonas pavanii]MBC9078114.1 VOC family protein [Stenotrophomonas maltophilia]MBC9092761.1 VOC family protein [Stenotrophomonas maltophilia]